MVDNSGSPANSAAKPEWYQTTAKYQRPDLGKASWQLVDTFLPYVTLLYLMHLTLQRGYPYWTALLLAIPAAGLLVRIFIFFHDACHYSFFKSSHANTLLGYICGIVTFTAYRDWQRTHGLHHARVGDLDNRGVGDIWTATTEEYHAFPVLKRFSYRCFRNPLVLFGLGPGYLFLIANRFSSRGARTRERRSVYLTNLAILVLIVVASYTVGFREYVLIQLPIMLLAGAAGMWLFYVQHQFEAVYWARHAEWDPMVIALQGSSYYSLPKVLQWFTGNIGFHHVHHIRPRIPNYNLQQCCDETPALQAVKPLTMSRSLKSLFLSLWDENQRKIVGFRSLKASAG